MVIFGEWGQVGRGTEALVIQPRRVAPEDDGKPGVRNKSSLYHRAVKVGGCMGLGSAELWEASTLGATPLRGRASSYLVGCVHRVGGCSETDDECSSGFQCGLFSLAARPATTGVSMGVTMVAKTVSLVDGVLLLDNDAVEGIQNR